LPRYKWQRDIARVSTQHLGQLELAAKVIDNRAMHGIAPTIIKSIKTNTYTKGVIYG